MRTINFNKEDIKQCKLALVKQNLTSLQSAFLMQYITNIEQENKQLKENYGRIYNENYKLREEHNITDISLLDENYKLKDNWNKLKEWVKMEHREDAIVINLTWKHATGRFLDKMQELEGSDSNDSN